MIRLFRVFIPTGIVMLLLCEVMLVLSSFVLATYLVMEVDPTVFLVNDGGLTRIAIALASIVFTLYLNDLYSRVYVRSRMELVQQLCVVMGITLLVEALVSYLKADLQLPVRIMLIGGSLTGLAIFLSRVGYSRVVLGVAGGERFLFVGGSPVLDEIASYLDRHPELRMNVVGCVRDDVRGEDPSPSGKVLGPLETLAEIAVAVKPDRIIVGMAERRRRMPLAALLELRYAGFVVQEAASVYESICSRVYTRQLYPGQLIFSGELGPRRESMLLQSSVDLAVALAISIVTLPFMLIAAVAVKLSSSGPILYRQTRVGRHGVPFTLYKFRSMYADAEARTGAVWASRDDPRITPVGKILRKTRIDELPQLFNVLRGEMAMVGPRPERPEFVDTLAEQIPYYHQRHAVKPGITGWAQINYKYGDTLEDTIAKLEYDLYYIKNMSLALDLYIMFHTAKAMLLTRGAQ